MGFHLLTSNQESLSSDQIQFFVKIYHNCIYYILHFNHLIPNLVKFNKAEIFDEDYKILNNNLIFKPYSVSPGGIVHSC